jgi:hypothetical protein
MNEQERQVILAALGESDSEEAVQRATDALVRYRARQEVLPLAKMYSAERQAMMESDRARYYYIFLAPKEKAVKIAGGKGEVELWQTPARQEYRVRVVDLAAFAKSQGLKLNELEEVAKGKRAETKGWAGYATGAAYDAGQPWRPSPRIKTPAERNPAPLKQMSVYSPAKPIIEWEAGAQ